jgi:putative phage-type endonuclease
MAKLQKISTRNMSREEWLEQRQYGIGGSDIGSIMGIDRFKPAVKLFHQKIGLYPMSEEYNLATYAGTIAEEHIYNHYWKFWDHTTHDPEDMLWNAKNNKVMRKARRNNNILINPKYPWLRANIDYEMPKQKGLPKGILELKTGNSKYWSMYEAELPTTYIFQVQMYMMVVGYEYSEIFGLLDGRAPKIFPIQANKELQEEIEYRTNDFWERVEVCKGIMSSKASLDEKQGMIAEYEPEVEETEAYETYMKERYKTLDPDKSIKASSKLEDLVIEYNKFHRLEKDSKDEKTLITNKLRRFMLLFGLNEIELEVGKKVSWFNNRLNVPKLKEFAKLK